jgi:imidazolonepropionase
MIEEPHMPADLNVVHASQLAVIHDEGGPRRGSGQGELDLVADGAVAIRQGRIAAVGPTDQVLRQAGGEVPTLDAAGLTVLPGLVECHCHPIFAGSRHWEYVRRLQGAASRQIRAEGGGIWSTVVATRQASDDLLLQRTVACYPAILAGGVTTLEVKSGYGLTLDQELRLLRLLRQSATGTPLDLVYTFLGAHVAPQDGPSPEDHVRLVRDTMLPAVVEQGIAGFHDLSCEEGDFASSLAAELLEASRRLGMPTRVHADASSSSRGWRTAVEGGAVAADHLTYTPDEEIRAVGKTETIAVLLPVAEQFYLDRQRANARLFVEQGVPVAIATDYCSSFQATSLALSVALACSWFRLTPAEALVGATLNAAYALQRGRDRGSLDVHKRGDLTLLDCVHPNEIGVRIGAPLVRYVVSRGRVVYRGDTGGAQGGGRSRVIGERRRRGGAGRKRAR